LGLDNNICYSPAPAAENGLPRQSLDWLAMTVVVDAAGALPMPSKYRSHGGRSLIALRFFAADG